MSRRDGAIVAWHEVPGTTPPQKSRPVGYGPIRAGVPTYDFKNVARPLPTQDETLGNPRGNRPALDPGSRPGEGRD
jgi:hypothetical protein